MLARLATVNTQPAQADDANVQYLRDTIKSVPGFVVGFHMLHEQSGKAYSLVVVEDDASSAQVREALAQRPAERRVGVDLDHVQVLTAIPF
ncbi:MAG: hypothetical protein JOY58_15345 [Solirubrobacterales bacterium]|nr:hypothetical protein [Solirubrobacterales bacterium]MBV9049650.1 hypothetical protein [Solirubrobacterales bacterium]